MRTGVIERQQEEERRREAAAAGPTWWATDKTTTVGLEIRPQSVFGWLVAASLVLATADLLSFALDGAIGSDQLRRVWDVDEESSIPTWFSSMQLLAAHGLLLVIALIKLRSGDGYAGHWFVLALIFLGLSMDEMVSLHEQTTLALQFEVLGLDGASWIAVGLPFVLAVALAYRRFVLALPLQSRWLLCLAAATFLGGAIGIEALDAISEAKSQVHTLIVAAEELLERLGIALLILWALSYLRDVLGVRRVSFG